ncbi:MAG: HEAT repeat domain-containing protein [Phycisphaerae bacterium]
MRWLTLLKLRSRKPGRRRRVVEQLGNSRDEGAFELLIEALTDKEVSVRVAASVALRKFDSKGAKSGAARAAFARVVGALKDEDADAREAAAEVLGLIGDRRAVEPLTVALHDEAWHVRRAAAKALGAIADERAFEPLVIALDDEEPHVRPAAAEALGMIGDKRALEPLIVALERDDWEASAAAAQALGKIGDVRSVEPLIAAVKRGHCAVQALAAVALGALGDPRAIEPLFALLTERVGSLAYCAKEALARLGVQEADFPPAFELYSIRLKHEDFSAREDAVESLRRLEDPRAVEPIIAALKDENYSVREKAAKALAHLADSRAIDSLTVALGDEKEEYVRRSIRGALDRIQSREKPISHSWVLADEDIIRDARDFVSAFEGIRATEQITSTEKPWQMAAAGRFAYSNGKATDALIEAIKDWAPHLTDAQISDGLRALWDYDRELSSVHEKDGVLCPEKRDWGEYLDPKRRDPSYMFSCVLCLLYLTEKGVTIDEPHPGSLKISV